MAALTGTTIYGLVTELLGGFQMSSVLFYQLLAIAQNEIESAREWMILKDEDTSKTALTTDSFSTSKALPTDFLFWQSDAPLILVDPNNSDNYRYYKEIPFSVRHKYKTQSYRFAVDYANSVLYLMGSVDRTYTIHMNYIKKTDDITAETSWVFPSIFHGILAFDVATLYKAGIDYDEVNKAGATDNHRMRENIWRRMVAWDARLQSQGLEGMDRDESIGVPFISGRVNLNE